MERPRAIMPFSGMSIVISGNATKLTYHWPDKKRSRRLIKKMTKRLGPQVTAEPCAYRMADGRMVVHPSIYQKMRKQSDANDTHNQPHGGA